MSLPIRAFSPVLVVEGEARGRGRGGRGRGGERGRGGRRPFDKHSATGKTCVALLEIILSLITELQSLKAIPRRRLDKAGDMTKATPSSRLKPPVRPTPKLKLAQPTPVGVPTLAIPTPGVPHLETPPLPQTRLVRRRPRAVLAARLRKRTTPSHSMSTSSSRRRRSSSLSPSSRPAKPTRAMTPSGRMPS